MTREWELLVCPEEPGDHRCVMTSATPAPVEWLAERLQAAGVDAWVEEVR